MSTVFKLLLGIYGIFIRLVLEITDFLYMCNAIAFELSSFLVLAKWISDFKKNKTSHHPNYSTIENLDIARKCKDSNHP